MYPADFGNAKAFVQIAMPCDRDHYLKRELYRLIQTDSRIFDFIQEGSLDGIWYWDLENPEEGWSSPRLKELFGYADHEFPNNTKWWQALLYPDDLEVVIDNLEKHKIDPCHPYDQVVRYRHKDGSVVWVRCRGIAIRNEEGEAVRMLGAHTDLTKLMQAEAALKDKADLLQVLRQLAATADEAVCLDTQLKIKLFTPETDNLLNLTLADVGRPLGAFIDNLNDPGLLDDVQHVLDRHAMVEKKLLTDDGSCYIRRIAPILAKDNEIDGVVIAFVDISQHARDEAAVRDSVQRLTYATEATGAAVWDCDLVADTSWWSEEHQELFGVRPTETGNLRQWWIERIHPGDRQRVLDSLDLSMASGDVLWACEYRYRRGDGSFANVLDKRRIARDENGKAVRVIGALQDITEPKLAELRMRRAERLASVGTLATGLVHEIKNPLAALQIAALAALNNKDEGVSNGKLERSLRNVAESATRCNEIVKKLQRFVGGQNTERQSDDLNEVIRRATESTRAFCENQNARIEWTAQQDLPPVAMCGLEIELLLVNLIHNAAQAGEAGTQITICTHRTPDSVGIAVRDNGPGICEETAQRAFEPFYSTRHSEGGMGLGLSIAYGIVVDHGGSIRIYGQPGEGTTVEVELPATHGDAARVVTPIAART